MNYLMILLCLLHYLIIINPADSKCQKSFDCGNLGSLEFPLAPVNNPACGVFMVEDCDSDHPKIQLEVGGRWYEIRGYVPPNSLFIRDTEVYRLLNDENCYAFDYLYLPKSPHSSFTVSPNVTFFKCWNELSPEDLQTQFKYYSHKKCVPYTLYYPNTTMGAPDPPEDIPLPRQCSLSRAASKPNQGQDSGEAFNMVTADFTLEWYVNQDCSNCHRGGGQCLTNTKNEFFCRGGSVMQPGRGRSIKMTIVIGCSVAAITSTIIILILFIRKKHTFLRVFGFHKAKSGNEKDIELFLKNNGHLALMRYTYSDTKKMTKSFTEKLGQGGYGSVYKGKLWDDRLVAVKILNESKGNGEEFMNEVASISRTSHINIVTLLGFCFEGTKRALIYEFMPNGSLEKYVQKTDSSFIEGELGWEKLFEISLGIARGLEYLHQGCNMRILHFDIKPHNILLDKDFNPRISDFGLAKLCPNRSSTVSMFVARGTIGYIAPEVFSRNFGEVSHKSDVYSYGMMVLEIAGGRKNIDRADVDRTSEIYFPEYFYRQLEMEGERDDQSVSGIMNGNEIELVKRKLIIVGLWCIQTNPRDRPSMTKVVAMLEGEVNLLDVPPKPYLNSSPRLAQNFSFSESTN